MNAKRAIQLFSISLLFTAAAVTQSCRDYENMTFFPEISKLQTDSFHLDGTVAVPLVDTRVKIQNFLPESDSSLWAEVDEDGLLHMRMYYREFISITMADIYPGINYSINNTGVSVPASQYVFKSDTKRMKIYDKMLSGHLFFNNPKITFKIKNELPLVTKFRMDTVHFFDYDYAQVTHAEDEFTTIPAPTNYATFAPFDFVIDTARVSDLDDAFSPVPHRIGFQITAGSQNTQNLPFSVTGAEKLTADVDIDLPLEVRLEDLFVSDTVPFAWDGTNYDQAKSVTLKLKFDNGFPFEGVSQIYFADTTNFGTVTNANIIDSLFTSDERGWIFKSAETDGAGYVTTTTISETEIVMTQERVRYLQEQHASRILLVGRFNHDPDAIPGIFVRIMGEYSLGMKVGVKLEYEGNTNDQF